MRKFIRITEVGEEESHYYSMYGQLRDDGKIDLTIGGLEGCFRLTKFQRKRLGKFLLRGLKKCQK